MEHNWGNNQQNHGNNQQEDPLLVWLRTWVDQRMFQEPMDENLGQHPEPGANQGHIQEQMQQHQPQDQEMGPNLEQFQEEIRNLDHQQVPQVQGQINQNPRQPDIASTLVRLLAQVENENFGQDPEPGANQEHIQEQMGQNLEQDKPQGSEEGSTPGPPKRKRKVTTPATESPRTGCPFRFVIPNKNMGPIEAQEALCYSNPNKDKKGRRQIIQEFEKWFLLKGNRGKYETWLKKNVFEFKDDENPRDRYWTRTADGDVLERMQNWMGMSGPFKEKMLKFPNVLMDRKSVPVVLPPPNTFKAAKEFLDTHQYPFTHNWIPLVKRLQEWSNAIVDASPEERQERENWIFKHLLNFKPEDIRFMLAEARGRNLPDPDSWANFKYMSNPVQTRCRNFLELDERMKKDVMKPRVRSNVKLPEFPLTKAPKFEFRELQILEIAFHELRNNRPIPTEAELADLFLVTSDRIFGWFEERTRKLIDEGI